MPLFEIYKAINDHPLPLPSFLSRVSAGFPSPADNSIDTQLDLNELLIKNPAATFYVRVQGESMKNAGISSGDILVVDRSLQPNDGAIIMAILHGEFTIKRLRIEGKKITLFPENPSYSAIEINEDSDFQIWGVITYVIHRAR